MDVKKFEVYHTTIQNQNPCPEIELKNVLFKITGAGFVGPIYHKTKRENELKAYIFTFFL